MEQAPSPRCGLRVAPVLWVFNSLVASQAPTSRGRPTPRGPPRLATVIDPNGHVDQRLLRRRPTPYGRVSPGHLFAPRLILLGDFRRVEAARTRVPVDVWLVSVEAPSPSGLTGSPSGRRRPLGCFRVELFIRSTFPRHPCRYQPTAEWAPGPPSRVGDSLCQPKR